MTLFKIRNTLILLALLPFTVFAQCEGQMRFTPTTSLVSSPLGDQALIPFKIELDEQLQACAHTLYLSALPHGLQARSQHGMTAFQPLSNAKDPLPRISDYFKIDVDNQRTTYVWLRSANRNLQAGEYSGQLEVRVNVFHAQSQYLNYDFAIEPKASIRFAGGKNTKLSGSNNYVVADLGELKTNNKHSVNLQIKANSNVRVGVQSQNGSLVHQSIPTETINYSMVLNNTQIARMNKTEIDLGRIIDESEIPLELTIGETKYAIAGRYNDTVSVTVNAY